MKLLKVHGSGNDFYMLDAQTLERQLTEAEIRQLAVLWVDRADHVGPIGRMRVINADGSEASMCGNGLRCVARYLAQQNQTQSFAVQTMYADIKVAKKS